MIGGKVIETIVLDDRVYVNCAEVLGGVKTGTECAIYVEKSDKSRTIGDGDIVWWQGDYAMWTPKDSKGNNIGGKSDIRLKRIGYSGVKRGKL